MKYPACGSLDVEDTSNPDTKLKDCECYQCGNQWEESYDPNPIQSGGG